ILLMLPDGCAVNTHIILILNSMSMSFWNKRPTFRSFVIFLILVLAMSCHREEKMVPGHTIVPLPQAVEMKSGYLTFEGQVSVKLKSAGLNPALEVIKAGLPGVDLVTN